MPQIYGKAARSLPTAVADSTQIQQRVTSYGDVTTVQMGDNHSSLADEGSYYKVCTLGTGITQHGTGTSLQAYSATLPLFLMKNTSATGKRLFLDYFRLISLASATASSSVQCAIVIEDADRYSSGGNVYAPVNVNSSVASSSAVTFYASNSASSGGIITASAASSPRQVSRHTFKTPAAAPAVIIGDIFGVDVGEHSSQSGTLSATSATAYATSTGPICVGPGHSLLVYLWYPAVTVSPQYEFEIGWWER